MYESQLILQHRDAEDFIKSLITSGRWKARIIGERLIERDVVIAGEGIALVPVAHKETVKLLTLHHEEKINAFRPGQGTIQGVEILGWNGTEIIEE